MKYLLFTFVIVVLKSSLQGQGMSVNDLVALSKLNESDRETFLNNKGLIIESVDKTENYSTIVYTNDSPKYWVSTASFNSGCKIFLCDFKDQKFYNFQKSQATKLGFKFIKQEISENNKSSSGYRYKSIQYLYQKNGNKLVFTSQLFEDHVQYEISYKVNCL